MQHKVFLDQLDDPKITAAIQQAEIGTTGEIRVFVTHRPAGDALTAARREFSRLKMHRTRDRNAVLIFVAPKSQGFAVIGDSGIDARAGRPFWDSMALAIGEQFRTGAFTAGIVRAIGAIGEQLSTHFPHAGMHENQLPDDVARDAGAA